ncbi:MAG: hypothetical protein DMF84_16740 [Acidobacteria bacterium]|nr:MAG: hypothetical protein DMF84_16740 [Acidobacteriota bacterium]
MRGAGCGDPNPEAWSLEPEALFSTEDTIVAIATPPGRGGLGVVRISGSAAASIASCLARRNSFAPRHATLARMVDEHGDGIDETIVTFFPAPHSYAWKSPRPRCDRSSRARCGSTRRQPRRVHVARVPEWPDQSRAGGSGEGFD